jgi:calcium-dependent protein kinase
MWSIGIVMYLLLFGKFPFHAETQQETIDLIINSNIKASTDEMWKGVSEEARDLLIRLLSHEPGGRPSASEALVSQWVRNYANNKSSSNRTLSTSLKKLKNFKTQMTLQKAVLAYIASQELSKEEEKEIKETFEMIDVDKNGGISKNELVDGYMSLNCKETEAKIKAQEIMDVIDLNRNDIIDYNEFLMANLAANGILTKERLKKAFNFFDSVINEVNIRTMMVS